jgi:membrane protein DedA with SNARE-associated domain
VVAADTALSALYAGILLGDMGLYGIGRLIALHRFWGGVLNRKRAAAFRAWLHGRLLPGVLAARCLPGLRLCAYVTFGFFAMPLPRLIACDVLAASIWTTGLFYLSYEFGALTLHWLGYWSWPAVILAFGVPIFLIQHLLRPEASAETARSKDDAGPA